MNQQTRSQRENSHFARRNRLPDILVHTRPLPSERRHPGFTLLEVLVALGLSVILLTAVYGAIHLTYQLSTAGREKMEQAQLVRALFRQMDADVCSVVFRIQEEVTAPSDGAAADEDSQTSANSGIGATPTSPDTTETAPPALTSDEAFSQGSSGVYGSSENLVLHVSRPSRPVSLMTSEDGLDAEGQSDLAAVSYFLAVRGGTGLAGMVADKANQGSLFDAPSTGTVIGLTRLEGDRLSVQFAEDTGDIESLAADAKILATEVVSLSFAYWDGLEWTDSWDTVSSGGLPSAIEITLGIDTSSRDASGLHVRTLNQRMNSSEEIPEADPTYYRHVVALPLAEPYVGQLSQ